jgi:inner membrane protein
MAGLIDVLARWTRSPAFKIGLISFLILLLMIPLLLVHALVYERESRARQVRQEVGQTWGPEQRTNGPFLVVPYTVRSEVIVGEKRTETFIERRAVFTPELLTIDGNIDAKTLRRSIFDVPVYGAKVRLSGKFATPRITDVTADLATVRWRDATVILGLTGVAGLKDAAVLKINGASDIPFAPSLGLPSANLTGMHAKLADAGPASLNAADKPPAPFAFSIDLTFNGSVAMEFTPAARETKISMTSNWPHPSFVGAFLPDDRQVTVTGFSATWKVPHLARSVPESWIASDHGGIERLNNYGFGVRMISPVDFYSLVSRAAKYGLMFLSLIFMAVFCLEQMAGKSVHSVQYMFTGVALVFFFVLLLSLAEHIGFGRAYLLAAVATCGLLATYIGATLRSPRQGMVMLGVLAITYLLGYFILKLEDYALLAGALLGFVALASVMFVTLRVKWSGSSAGA